MITDLPGHQITIIQNRELVFWKHCYKCECGPNLMTFDQAQAHTSWVAEQFMVSHEREQRLLNRMEICWEKNR